MKSKSLFAFGLGFLFGVLVTIAAYKVKFFFAPVMSHFPELEEEMDQVMNPAMNFNLSLQGLSEIVSREDDKYYYYEIKGEKGKLKDIQIQVESGMIHIAGKFESKSQGSVFNSNIVSSFERSFPVPDGADEKGMQLDQTEDKITISIPKRVN